MADSAGKVRPFDVCDYNHQTSEYKGVPFVKEIEGGKWKGVFFIDSEDGQKRIFVYEKQLPNIHADAPAVVMGNEVRSALDDKGQKGYYLNGVLVALGETATTVQTVSSLEQTVENPYACMTGIKADMKLSHDEYFFRDALKAAAFRQLASRMQDPAALAFLAAKPENRETFDKLGYKPGKYSPDECAGMLARFYAVQNASLDEKADGTKKLGAEIRSQAESLLAEKLATKSITDAEKRFAARREVSQKAASILGDLRHQYRLGIDEIRSAVRDQHAHISDIGSMLEDVSRERVGMSAMDAADEFEALKIEAVQWLENKLQESQAKADAANAAEAMECVELEAVLYEAGSLGVVQPLEQMSSQATEEGERAVAKASGKEMIALAENVMIVGGSTTNAQSKWGTLAVYTRTRSDEEKAIIQEISREYAGWLEGQLVQARAEAYGVDANVIRQYLDPSNTLPVARATRAVFASKLKDMYSDIKDLNKREKLEWQLGLVKRLLSVNTQYRRACNFMHGAGVIDGEAAVAEDLAWSRKADGSLIKLLQAIDAGVLNQPVMADELTALAEKKAAEDKKPFLGHTAPALPEK
ncbi:hypothetical protein HY642_05830 [Candidatus Woesearchaeota archaeon]|nr:hypothetical protein [Candidatus Woesearchaeota archaeon]